MKRGGGLQLCLENLWLKNEKQRGMQFSTGPILTFHSRQKKLEIPPPIFQRIFSPVAACFADKSDTNKDTRYLFKHSESRGRGGAPNQEPLGSLFPLCLDPIWIGAVGSRHSPLEK